MLFFLKHGYRVIAHDRRGHGRSSQPGNGHDINHYADDLAALTAHLGLKDAIHIGHSTGGGEVVYIARHGEKPRRKSCDTQRRAAVDGEDRGQPRRGPQIAAWKSVQQVVLTSLGELRASGGTVVRKTSRPPLAPSPYLGVSFDTKTSIK